jgi:hypothetical protein
LTGSQVVHVDDDYESERNNGTYICFVATSNCQICVMKGSHKFKLYKDFMTNKVSFSIPIICNMKAGERLFCHMKLFHCGWSCEDDNFRLFYLLNLHHNDTQVHVLDPKICDVYNGVKQKIHHKNFQVNAAKILSNKRHMKKKTAFRFLKPEEKRSRNADGVFVDSDIETEVFIDTESDDSKDEDYVPKTYNYMSQKTKKFLKLKT